jgi:hypothetical protein
LAGRRSGRLSQQRADDEDAWGTHPDSSSQPSIWVRFARTTHQVFRNGFRVKEVVRVEEECDSMTLFCHRRDLGEL